MGATKNTASGTGKSTASTESLKQITYLAGALKAPRITDGADAGGGRPDRGAAQAAGRRGLDAGPETIGWHLGLARSRREPQSLTEDGQRVAIFYTKVHNRLLDPLIAANAPPAPLEVRRALPTIDRHVNDRIDRARLKAA